MVPLSDRGRRLLMIAAVHNAFFDESGTHDGSEIVAMGGLVSSYDNRSRWEVEWNNILRARGIKVFHFSESMARKGEFDNEWTDLQRDNFMERLCTTVSDNIVVGVAVSTFRDQFERVVPKDLQKQIKHPYYFGLYHCLWQILTLERISRGRITLQKSIRFLFDRKKGFESFASGIYYSVKEEFDKRLKWNTGFGDIGLTQNPKSEPGIS
jgi:hypothetical protein